MRRFIISALVLSAVTVNAQVKNGMVGINTDEPRATMHIEPGVSESKGLIIPRITAAQMKTMSNLAHFGADHHAIITYLKETLPAADRTGKLVDVADPGYYYYDNTTGVQKWRTFGGGAEQDLRVVGTNNHITQDAGVGGTGTSVGTGGGNIALGRGTLNSNTTGWGNIVLGVNALNNNTTGYGNIAQGTLALENNTTGDNNIALGANALMYNSTGNHNIALGNETLIGQSANPMIGSENIALGRYSLRGNTTGSRNIAIGSEVLPGNTTGFRNIALGTEALKNNTTGYENIALGTGALKGQGHLQPVEGQANIAIGSSALSNTTTGSSNIALGGGALRYNTTGGNNIAIGANAIGGQYNVFSQGGNNIAIGANSLFYSTTANNNIALGIKALGNSTTGSGNIALGYRALEGSSSSIPMTGTKNIAIGEEALVSNNTGNYNIANGHKALANNVSGRENISLGYESGRWIRGNGNIHIGNLLISNPMAGQLSNVVVIGNEITPTTSNSTDNVILLGKTGLDAPRVGVGTYKPQAKLDVAGAVRVANDTSACTSANEGAIRYVSASKKFQGCDGTGWVNLN